jgi:tRNA 2-thiouridine synthesizing protein A
MIDADAEWDAGDMGCGHLLIQLRKRLSAMPGGTLKLISRDPGSPEDIPTWCRLTQNTLLAHHAPSRTYWIRSRTEWP